MSDTEPYTPSLDEVKDQWRDTWHPRNNEASDASFDRMIAAHDHAVRREERERIGDAINATRNAPTLIGLADRYGGWYQGQRTGLELAEDIARIPAQGDKQS